MPPESAAAALKKVMRRNVDRVDGRRQGIQQGAEAALTLTLCLVRRGKHRGAIRRQREAWLELK